MVARDDDPMVTIRARLNGLDQEPVSDHAALLGHSLDAIVAELDELARSIPSAR